MLQFSASKGSHHQSSDRHNVHSLALVLGILETVHLFQVLEIAQ